MVSLIVICIYTKFKVWSRVMCYFVNFGHLNCLMDIVTTSLILKLNYFTI